MKLITIGGSPPRAILEGDEDEIRRLAPLLMREVLVVENRDAVEAADVVLARANSKRIGLGWSWRQVAVELEIGASTLSRWTTGRGTPNARTLMIVAQWSREP